MKGKYWWTLAGGFIAGLYGPDLIASRAAQTVLRYLVAGAMIARDRIMADSERIQAAASDISADAKEITQRYYDRCDEAALDFEEAVD